MSDDITFSIIKPDAFSRGDAARILFRIAEAGFTIAALKMIHMTRAQAEGFYAVHRERPFFEGLVEFMSTGPVMVMVLRHPDAVERFRSLIGTTDPAKAAPGTIRAEYGTTVQRNAVHGSDSAENAFKEASYFFSAIEIF
ncbi:MAG: nucleoside-diphosphate kinase [Bacteroidales bacterium]|jgi:nucleoside-diphosphate kinase|nr:nucleoside-diphosphate kinase [Bacteroidales bacterium]NLD63938.1 nucleoside-diphosphate kinase [Bacteroidales bacterium]HNT92221.1 nucleoside-diphosphate kinase [Bacteroidales bacterium]HOO67135.1 nucleoside-diphosphate kinase [Bacteroidales bacterium]HPE22074.1 nucleoside-diphosphate kinase [Bacteroidales bacterium]